MDRTARPLVIIGAFAGSLVVGLVLMLWAMGGLRHVTAPAAIGGPFQLTDQAGQTVTEKSMQGHPTLVFFGFTHCPDVCPTTLFEMSEVLKAMGKDADRVNAYYISVDPERDTQAAMKEYLSSFDPRLKGLTGNPEADRQGAFRIPRLCQESPAEGRRLHHGPHRADLSDGSRRQISSRRSTSIGSLRKPRPTSSVISERSSTARADSPQKQRSHAESDHGWSIRPRFPKKHRAGNDQLYG